MENATIGLIGVGLLGSSIAERLIAAGARVVGWDTDGERIAALGPLGGTKARGAEEVFRSARRIVLALPTSGVVKEVVARAGELAGRIVIDTTTGDPVEVEAIAADVSARGGAYIDATVAGSSAMVRRGEAIGLVGGADTAVEESADILDAIAPKRFHLGPTGSGSRMKLVVNLVLGLNRAVLAEGLALARAYGMDLKAVLEVLKAGPTYSRAMDTKGPKMVSAEFTLEARLSQHWKDVRLILQEAERLGARTPLSEVHERLLAELEERGLGGEDNSAIIRAYEAS